MNSTLQELTSRKSVRLFTEDPISEDDVQAILNAAVQAPTAGNQQLYTILNITDSTLKQQLAEACDHQSFIASAPLVLVFLADTLKWQRIYETANVEHRNAGVGDLVLAIDDAVIASQNAVTAAWSLGIGSCYIGDVMEQYETIRDCLRLPAQVFPAAMLVFGYPTPQQKERIKPQRCDLDLIVRENTYPDYTEEEYKRFVQYSRKAQAFQPYVEAFCNRKYNSDFSMEMQRSVECYLKDFQETD